jgi:hypothetical protein
MWRPLPTRAVALCKEKKKKKKTYKRGAGAELNYADSFV